MSNFLALKILKPETVKLNVTKRYILVDVVEFLSTVASIFIWGGCKSDITDFSFYQELS